MLSEYKSLSTSVLMAQTTADSANIKEFLANVGLTLEDLKEMKKKMTEMGVKGDIPSMLQKIAALEQENGALKDEVQKKETRVSQLTQKTQEEMRKVLETQITEWLSRLKAENNEKKIDPAVALIMALGRAMLAPAAGVGSFGAVACRGHRHRRGQCGGRRQGQEECELWHDR